MAEGRTASPQLATSTAAIADHFNFPSMSNGSEMSNGPEPSFTEVKGAASATDQLPVRASDTNSAASLTAKEVTSHSSVTGFSDNSSDSETPTAETALVTTAVLTTRSSVESGATVAVETLFTTDSELAVVSSTSLTAGSGPTSVVLATSLESTSVTTAVTEATPTPELSVVPVLATSSAPQSVTTAVAKTTTAPALATFPTSELVTPTVTETASTPEVNTTPVLSAFSATGSAAADVTSSTLASVESNIHSSLPWTVTSTFRGASSAADGGDTSGVTAPAGGPPNTYVTGSTEGAAGVGPSLADAAASTAVTHDSGTVAAAATDSNLFLSWTIKADATSSEIPAARTSGISSAAYATKAVETSGVSATSFLPLAAGTSEATVTGFTPHASETSGVSVTSTSAQAAGTSDVSTTSLRALASSSLDNDTTVTSTDLFLSTTTTMPPDSVSTPRDSGASNATVADVFETATDVSAATDNASDNTTTMSTPLDVTDTTVAPPAQSSPHTSLASTPDHLSSTVTGGQPTTDLDGSGYIEGGSGGAISDRPTTSVDDWPSGVSLGPERGNPRVTSLDNGTSNGTVATSHAGLTGNDTLIIILPVCLAIFVFIVIIIALALFCYRRKRKKQEAHHSNEDLWVKPPTESFAPLSVSSGEASVPDNVPEKPVPGKPVYTVIHEFPALQATQLSLTVGDSVVVEEKADNGWWRGYIAKNPERSGWFPSSFVEGIKDENSEISSCPAAVDMEVESGSSRRPTISSFLIRKKSDDNPLLSNSFSLGKLSAQSKAASVQDRSNPVIQTASPGNVVSTGITADDLTNAVQGKHFKALFAYKAAFRGELNLREGEIITGKERDRNGWMLGTKLKTKEEGWFPAVYVDQIVGELPQEETPTLHVERMELDQEVYGQLAVNRTKSPDQAWLGIEHVANYGYHGHLERELNFKKGDVLMVFEAQESGWWLGCHGDNVGWFPGSYVELLEQKSDNDGISLELLSPQMRNKDGSSKDLQSQRSSTASSSSEITKDSTDVKSLASASSESIIGEKPKPARKAPHPPSAEKNTGNGGSVVVSGTGTLSRNLRPVRPAPAPPPPTSRARPDSVSSMDRLSTTNARMNHGTGENNGTRTVPLKKTRKPKIVRIPKEKVGLDKISSCAVPKRPVPSVHEGEKPQKDDKENNTKWDKEETTKQDSDCTSDGEIEKECSLLAECMSKLVSKTSDVDGVSSEAQVYGTKTNNTDIFDSASPTNDDPDSSSLSHSSGNQNCSSPFTPNQDQGEKITHDPNADPMLTSQISDQSNLSTEEEAFPQQGSLPDFSDSKPNPHSNHGTSNDASGHVHGLPDSDSWGNIGERMSSTPASQEESVRESVVLPPSEDSHLVQAHNPSDPQPGNSSDSSKPPAILPDSPLVSELPSSQRYSGHWKFHRDREQGQKPLRLTKVPPPVVPVPVNKKDGSEGDGEEMLSIPPLGVSGHVSLIVHQINQRLSMDPKNIDRKPSRQLSSSSSHNEEYSVPNANSAEESSLLHHQINHSSMVAQTNAQNAVVNGLNTNDTVQSSLAGMVSSDSGKQTVQCKTSNNDSDISNTKDSTSDLPNVYQDTSDDIHRPASIMKTKRPPPPKSPPPSMFKKLSRLQTPRVWRTLKNYSAQRDDELSYSTGVFIRELSENEERPGWVYGILTDGASGFFSASFAEIASSDIETEL